MKSRIRISGLAIAAVLLLTFAPASGVHAAAPGGDVIKFGVVTSLTGPAGAYGLSTRCSMDSFAQFINARGGVTVNGKTYTIEFVYGDDKLQISGARAAAEKLLYTDNVDFFVASFARTMINAWAPLVMKEKKITLIGGPNFEPRSEWPYLFHVGAPAKIRSLALCHLMKEKFGAKSVFYINSDSEEGHQASRWAEEYKEERGLEVKGFLHTTSFARDFYPILTQVLKTKPDFIMCDLLPGATALFIKQARELGYQGRIVTINNMPSNIARWQKIVGVEASKGFIAFMGDRSERSELGLVNTEYFDKNCPQYRSTDISYVLQPHLILLALEKAQSFDPDVLRETLLNEKFQTLIKIPLATSGKETFGNRQHISVPVEFSQIVGNDEVEFLKSFPYVMP